MPRRYRVKIYCPPGFDDAREFALELMGYFGITAVQLRECAKYYVSIFLNERLVYRRPAHVSTQKSMKAAFWSAFKRLKYSYLYA